MGTGSVPEYVGRNVRQQLRFGICLDGLWICHLKMPLIIFIQLIDKLMVDFNETLMKIHI